MSFTLTGIPVSRGIAIGRAHLIARAALEVHHYFIAPDAVEAEVARLRAAMQAVQIELAELRRTLPKEAPEEMAAFLEVHEMILHDDMLTTTPERLIAERHYNAEWALATQLEEVVRQFDEIADPYLRERKADVTQVVERVLNMLAIGNLTNASPLNATQTAADLNWIVVAHDVSPADMLQFKHQTFVGFATDLGGRNSHTAIMARSLDIPAAVGLQHATELIHQDDWLIIDGDAGIVIVDPSPIILEEYQARQNAEQRERKKLQRLLHTPTQTKDGVAIELLANIEMPDDAPHALAAGVDGIGLFRSEFLFMNRGDDLPNEEEQFSAYRSVVETMKGRSVTIRIIDIGADKPLDADDAASCANPALGLRAIRWALSEPRMFLVQLRAILRASAFGPVRILLPMVAHVSEVEQTRILLARAKQELDAAGQRYDPKIKIGAMIEIPAAVLSLSMLLPYVDFLSIGTNDLIQYTLAIDRSDSAVAHLYDPLHPAVLQLIARTIRQAQQVGMSVSVCGEMAGDTTMTRLLLGMGLREFSMHPTQLLAVKREILSVEQSALQKNLEAVLNAPDMDTLRVALATLQDKEN